MKTSKLVWIPRIILILITALIAIFAFDGLEYDALKFGKLLALLIHLFPSFLMIVTLIIAWIKPKIGGILCIILGVLMGVQFRVWNVFTSEGQGSIFPLLIVVIPLIIIGIMFIVFGKSKEKAF